MAVWAINSPGLHAIGGLIAFCSFVVAVIAWRGRTVNDHPHCRWCGYDLFMKAAGDARCPECGNSLDRRRATYVGKRQVRPRLLASAIFVLVVSGTDCGVHGYRWGRAKDWDPYKPLWWLEWRADAGIAAARDAALAELTRRARLGGLPPSHEAALVAKALAYQADAKRPWVAGWGDIVQALFAAGRLSPQLWDQYELGALQLHLEPAAGTMRSCDPVRFNIVHGPDRVGHSVPEDEDDFTAVLFFNHRVKIGSVYHPAKYEMWISAWSIEKPSDEGEWSSSYYIVGLDNTRYVERDPLVELQAGVELAPGRRHSEMSLRIRATRFRASFGKCQWHGEPRTISLSSEWTMAASPRVSHDPSLAPAVLKSIAVSDIRFERHPRGGDPKYDGWSVYFTLDCKSPPIDLAYELFVYIPSDNGNYSLVQLYLPRGSSWHRVARFDGTFWKETMKNDPIRLRLVADPKASPPGTTDVWGEGIECAPGASAQPLVRRSDRLWWSIYGVTECISMNP